MRLVVVLFIVVQAIGNGQEIYYPTEKGTELLNLLVTDFKPLSELLSYGETRDSMYRHVYRDNDGFVTCYYTGHSIFLPDEVDPSAFLYDNENPNGITAEHIYPQSKGAANGNARVDMHSLVPCIWRANQARSNYPFGEIADEETDHWYAQTEDLRETPITNIDDYSERLNGGFGNLGKFEPRESVKGDIARAVFYFYTMYKTEADAADPEYFENMKEDLLLWHYSDPVSELEFALNKKKASYQENKINPFIVDCSLVERAYFPDELPIGTCENNFSSAVASVNEHKQLSIFPNPVNGALFLDGFGFGRINRIVVFDFSGKVYLETERTDIRSIDCSDLRTGLYVLSVYWNGGNKHFRFLKV